MRIGIFTDTYFPQVSGVATSIRVLKKDLERQGHKVIIFTTTDPKVTEPEENIIRLGSIPFLRVQGSSCGDSRARESLPNCKGKQVGYHSYSDRVQSWIGR